MTMTPEQRLAKLRDLADTLGASGGKATVEIVLEIDDGVEFKHTTECVLVPIDLLYGE